MPACAESEVIMNENRPKGNQKHIDLSGRIRIEQGLNNGESFRTIARNLNKDPSTISKEVRRHSVIKERKPDAFAPIPCANNYDASKPKANVCKILHDAEIMSALINVLTAERQDAVKFVTTINRDSVKNLLSLHMHVTAVQRKRTA